jgi:hypothetical protein
MTTEDRQLKTVMTYRIEKKLVSKAVAKRKSLPKFGNSKEDRPGPNHTTTLVAEELFMQFVANKDECDKEVGEKSALDLIKEKFVQVDYIQHYDYDIIVYILIYMTIYIYNSTVFWDNKSNLPEPCFLFR